MPLTQDEAIAAALSTCPCLSADDLRGMLLLPQNELVALLATYRDAGKIPSPSAGQVLLDGLKVLAEIAGYVLPVEGVLAEAIGIVRS